MGYLIILIIIVSLVSWLIKIIYQSKLEKGLGRKVNARELTSLNAWLKVDSDRKD